MQISRPCRVALLTLTDFSFHVAIHFLSSSFNKRYKNLYAPYKQELERAASSLMKNEGKPNRLIKVFKRKIQRSFSRNETMSSKRKKFPFFVCWLRRNKWLRFQVVLIFLTSQSSSSFFYSPLQTAAIHTIIFMICMTRLWLRRGCALEKKRAFIIKISTHNPANESERNSVEWAGDWVA